MTLFARQLRALLTSACVRGIQLGWCRATTLHIHLFPWLSELINNFEFQQLRNALQLPERKVCTLFQVREVRSQLSLLLQRSY